MLMRPFSMHLDFKTGELTPRDRTNIRKLSDMKGMFLDTKTELLLEKENPPIYSFQERMLSEEKDGDIERTGFAKILIEKDGKPLLIDNPRWKKL